MNAATRKTFLLWSNRIFWSSTTLTFAAIMAGLGLSNNPDGSNFVISGSLGITILKAGVFAALEAPFLVVGIRFALVKVVVTNDKVVVHGPFRTVTVERSEVLDLTSPDYDATQFVPKLRTRDGKSVKLFALSRLKNRLWGDAKHMRRSLHELAACLEVPLIEDESAARSMHWG